MLSKKRKTFVWIISILIALTVGFIWIHSCFPRDLSTEESTVTTNLVQRVFDAVFGEGKIYIDELVIRKIAHFSEFFALGTEFAFLLIALKRESYKSYLTLLPIGLFVGAVDETIQIFSDRGAAVTDVLLDFFGYAFAVAVFLLIFFIREKKKKLVEKE